jgi:signal transduction histidine kinase/CheY-like chemotaxis protein/HAMP domain-containing protein
MKRFKDIESGNQLLMGFGAIIVLLLFVSLVAWQQTNTMAHKTNHIYNHSLALRIAIDEFHQAVLNIRIEFRNILLADNEEDWKKAVRNREQEKEKALHAFNQLYEKYTLAISDIDTLKYYFINWNLFQQESFEKSTYDAINETLLQRAETGDIASARNHLLSQIQHIQNSSRNRADQYYNEAVQSNKKLNTQLLVFSVAVICLSLLIAIYLSRLINRPLKVMSRAMNLYRSGDKTARSAFTSANEFGQLSDTFNEMAEILEADSFITNRAAELAGLMLSENDAQQFCYDLLKDLLEHTHSQMGAIYLLSADNNHFEHFESIGMAAAGCKPFSAIRPEGEFGLALASRKISHLKNISEESRFRFNTVSGSFKPCEIITIPIFNGNDAVALISIFSIQRYSEISVRLVESIFSTLTARMNGILAYKQVVEFSKKLEVQNAELDAQKNELTIMAEELKVQNAELEVQKHQLGEVSRLKTNFLSSMSHELRTPLNSVIALTGVLSRRLANKIEEEEYGYLEVIERNGKHLLDLINDILDLSRIESGKVEIATNRFNINTLISEVVAMIKPQADMKRIGLNYTLYNTDLVIESDYNKCFHIFQNIIGNAVKFTETGSVDITVSTQTGNVVVRVSDSGIGIHKTELPHIFDEFRQADGSNSRKYGGTGLGLSIANKYAKLLGCVIKVESEVGKGSVFTVSIPLIAIYSDQDRGRGIPEIIRSRSEDKVKISGEGKTILLVEDTGAMIVQITDILEAENYTVVSAKNGFEALDQLGKSIPDAVILDLMMPGMDGFELLNKMRSLPQTAELPVLVLTAKILSNEELREIKNNHVHQLLQKGRVKHDSLLEAVALMMQ